MSADGSPDCETDVFAGIFDISVKYLEFGSKNNLHNKLIYGNKENVLNETLKYKQEIIQLTQENKQIADEIMSLKEKIKHMEEIIGRDHPERLMNYTK